MVSIVDTLRDGGLFAYAVLMLAVLGSIVAMVGGGMGLARIRVPAFLWLAVPLLMITVGAGGELQGLVQASDAISGASPEMRGTLAHAGAAIASIPTTLAMLATSVLLGLGAWLAALPAAIMPGEDAKTTPLTAAGGAALAALAGLALVAWAAVSRSSGVIIGASLVMISPALLIAGVRAGSGDADRARAGEARVSVALCVLGAATSAGLYAYLSGEVITHQALAFASAEMKMTLLAAGREQQRFATQAGAIAALAAAFAGVLAIGPLARAALSGRTAISLVLAVLGLLAFGGAEAGVMFYRSQLQDVWSNPALMGIRDTIPDMPLPHDLDGEDAYGASIQSYAHVVSWPRGGAPTADLPLPGFPDETLRIALATSAETPVADIAQKPWSDNVVVIDLLLASSWMPEDAVGDRLLEPLLLSTLPLRWLPSASLDEAQLAELYSDDATIILYAVGGEIVLHHGGIHSSTHDTLPEAASAVRMRIDQGRIDSLAVAPTTWTAQELVGLANTVNDGRWGDEKVEMMLLPQHTQPTTAAAAGGLGGLGGLGSLGGLGRLGSQSPAGGITDVAQGVTVTGSLDKEQISAVVQRHTNQIRYCYQRELTKDPSLSGRVEVKFVIASDGSVSSASIASSTMGNDAVEQCIAGRFQRFRFPEPAGGGIVLVRFPFVFAPG